MKVMLTTFVLLVLAVTGGTTADAMDELRAGAAAVDITPTQFPLNMPGGFNANQAEKAHDPLHARSLVLDDGTTSLAMVVVDNLGLGPDVLDEAKERASAKTGIPVDRMLICSTHTHTAPPASSQINSPTALAYRELLLSGLVASIVDAHDALQPAAIGVATHPLPEEVFNRRWYLKPGKMPLNPFGELDIVKMNPGTNPAVLDRPAGPVDPDVTVISVQDAMRRPLALFANYSLHYVGGVPPRQVSADYFGEFARLMPSRMRAGDGFIAMMSNGASGDVNNIPFTVVRPPREPFEQIRLVAGKAADAAWFAHAKIERHQRRVRLGMLQRDVMLTYRRPTADQINKAKEVLAIEENEALERLPRLAQHYARNTIRAAEREEDTLTVKLQALQIGDLAVCGVPFETFTEMGLELKDRSPFPLTMVIGLANGRHGYLPTPEQHRLGGYETWIGTNLVQEDASVILTENLLEMLGELEQER